MSDFTPHDLIACAKREVRMRRHAYPRWVAQEKIKAEDAAREIALMEAIVAKLESMFTPELFT